ncbi:MAG TPA: hypothetical protein VHG08_20050 [Longimicrobium sp.]|nr:hypothetical protein [Longimicrobium sp.]
MPQYDDHVFINCPFDREYQPIVEALVFAVHDCGFVARSSLEATDGAEVRIEKIYRIIGECRVGIHDISRIEPDSRSGFPRFNMPLELGLFLGARRYGSGRQKRKACLILEREPFDSQKYCSDIAGQDVRSHYGNPQLAIGAVRSTLASLRGCCQTATNERCLSEGAPHGNRVRTTACARPKDLLSVTRGWLPRYQASPSALPARSFGRRQSAV